MVNSHLKSTADGKTSELSQLENELYSLGVDTMTEAKPDVIAQLRQQIQSFGILDMNAADRRQFYNTPEGELFLQNAQDFGTLSQNIRSLESAHNEVLENVNDTNLIRRFNDQRLNMAAALRRVSNSIQGRAGANPIIPRDDPVPPIQAVDPVVLPVVPEAGVRPNIELVRSARARAGMRLDTRPATGESLANFSLPPLKREGSSGIGTSIATTERDEGDSQATVEQSQDYPMEDDDDKED